MEPECAKFFFYGLHSFVVVSWSRVHSTTKLGGMMVLLDTPAFRMYPYILSRLVSLVLLDMALMRQVSADAERTRQLM